MQITKERDNINLFEEIIKKDPNSSRPYFKEITMKIEKY